MDAGVALIGEGHDEAVIEEGLRTVKKVLAENYVRPDEAEKVKSTIRERGSLKVIDKVTVTLNTSMKRCWGIWESKGRRFPRGVLLGTSW